MQAAAAGELPTLTSVSTAASNVVMAPLQLAALQPGDHGRAVPAAVPSALDGSAACLEHWHEGVHGSELQGASSTAAASMQQQQRHVEVTAGGGCVLRLGSKVVRRSLTANNGAQAGSIVRGVW